MKRRDLLAYLEEHGCTLVREGGRHSIYQNTDNKQSAPVPRHKEISDLLVRKICKQLGISSPK
jgi:mRNA interferase HicA